jgi:hypothetical protein
LIEVRIGGICNGMKARSGSTGNGKSNERIHWGMDDDLAKIKKIVETLIPDISVVEFIPPAPPAENDEEPEPDQKSRKIH